jgi:hypothetical protein
MSWIQFTDDTGKQWALHQMNLYMLIREYLHATATLRRSKIVRVSRFIGPDDVYVETDTNGLRAEKDRQAPAMYEVQAKALLKNAKAGLGALINMRDETLDAATELRKMQKKTTTELFENVEKSVWRKELATDGLKLVRDSSATIITVGSVFLTGGAALTALGGASVMKGGFTFQDTGSVPAAMIDATGNFLMGAIGVGTVGTAARSSVMTLRSSTALAKTAFRESVMKDVPTKGAFMFFAAVLGGSTELTKGAITGKPIEDALKAAGTKMAVDALSMGLLGPILDSRAWPVAARLVTDSFSAVAGDKLVSWAGEPPKQNLPKPESLFDVTTDGERGERFILRHILHPIQ